MRHVDSLKGRRRFSVSLMGTRVGMDTVNARPTPVRRGGRALTAPVRSAYLRVPALDDLASAGEEHVHTERVVVVRPLSRDNAQPCRSERLGDELGGGEVLPVGDIEVDTDAAVLFEETYAPAPVIAGREVVGGFDELDLGRR